MPAFDELRNQLDGLKELGFTINQAFHQLVKSYSDNAETTEELVYLMETLEEEGQDVTWPD